MFFRCSQSRGAGHERSPIQPPTTSSKVAFFTVGLVVLKGARWPLLWLVPAALSASTAGKTMNRTYGPPRVGSLTELDGLAVIAHRAQAYTNASGAAIALPGTTPGELICQARSGSRAPDVGTTLQLEGTFTGLCVQSRRLMRCDDTERETRVDTAAARVLGVRSMMVAPIAGIDGTTGALALFSFTPNAFSATHEAVLKTLADEITQFLHKQAVTAAQPAAPAASPALPPLPVQQRPGLETPAPPPQPVQQQPDLGTPGLSPVLVRTFPKPATGEDPQSIESSSNPPSPPVSLRS